MFEDRLLSVGIGILIDYLRDSTKHAKWRKAMLKVFRAIADAYGNDKEFLDVAKAAFKK